MSVRFIFYSKVKTEALIRFWFRSIEEFTLKETFSTQYAPKIVALSFHTTETSVTSTTTFFLKKKKYFWFHIQRKKEILSCLSHNYRSHCD